MRLQRWREEWSRDALREVYDRTDGLGRDHRPVADLDATEAEIDALRLARLVVVVDGHVAMTPAGHAALGVCFAPRADDPAQPRLL